MTRQGIVHVSAPFLPLPGESDDGEVGPAMRAREIGDSALYQKFSVPEIDRFVHGTMQTEVGRGDGALKNAIRTKDSSKERWRRVLLPLEARAVRGCSKNSSKISLLSGIAPELYTISSRAFALHKGQFLAKLLWRRVGLLQCHQPFFRPLCT